jgi:hypothetical protein
VADALAIASARKDEIEAELKNLQGLSLGDQAFITIGKSPAISIPSTMLSGVVSKLIEVKTAEARTIGQAIDTVQSCEVKAIQ